MHTQYRYRTETNKMAEPSAAAATAPASGSKVVQIILIDRDDPHLARGVDVLYIRVCDLPKGGLELLEKQLKAVQSEERIEYIRSIRESDEVYSGEAGMLLEHTVPNWRPDYTFVTAW